MKNKSLFIQIITIIIVAIICLLTTLVISFLAGSLNVELFDFQNLKFSNMIPILLVGGFISCVIVGISVLFVMRTAFFKAKDFLKTTNKEKGEQEK